MKFAPLNVPLHRSLETLAAGGLTYVVVFGGPIGLLLLIYLLFYTRFWPIGVIYIFWTYIIDKDISEKGGRRMEWVRGWSWWRYLQDYFPVHLERVPGVELDPKQNYLFCCFPHGILPLGVFTNFAYNYNSCRSYFPHHTATAITLRANFYVPIIRELFLSLGGCSASKTSLHWLLNSGCGRILVLIVGGSAEAFYSRPGQYRIILNKRKGFVKLALRYGTALVPLITFGETDTLDQLDNRKGSLVRRFQEWVKSITGVAPILPIGRGFSLIPFRTPLTTIVGKPIEVTKTENPTQEQIDALHAHFKKKLIELFEEEKHKYLSDHQNVSLIIE